jgi:hypothetical protein
MKKNDVKKVVESNNNSNGKEILWWSLIVLPLFKRHFKRKVFP